MKAGIINFGRVPSDHTNGSLMFVKPQQIIAMKNLKPKEERFTVLIHEDYLNGHELRHTIQQYGYCGL